MLFSFIHNDNVSLHRTVYSFTAWTLSYIFYTFSNNNPCIFAVSSLIYFGGFGVCWLETSGCINMELR